jgi:hypothetical protein
MPRLIWFLFFPLAGLGPLPGHAAITPPSAVAPTLQKIIENTLARDDLQQQALQSTQYDQTASIDQLDDSGKVTQHEVLRMIIRPGANPSMQIVSVQGDNIPTNPDDAEAQAKGRDVEGNKQTFTLRMLVNRFNITLAGEDKIAGQPAYVIAFAPKPNQPYHDETEKVVNQLQGHMWISAQTYNVLQTEAGLARPVSIAWFLAKIPTLDFHYSAPDINTGFAPCQIQITLQVNALFVGFHERQTIEMMNFRPRPAEVIAPAKNRVSATISPP